RRERARAARGLPGGEGAGGAGFPGGVEDPGAEWRTGARTGMKLGFVERIKDDPVAMLLVRVRAGERGPEPLRLRGLAYDVFTGTEWQRSPAAQREAHPLDGAAGSWQEIATEPSGRGLWRLSVTDLAGQREGPLFLLAEPERIRLTPEATLSQPVLAADGTVFARERLPAGAVYEEEARDDAFDAAAVRAAESTPASAPLSSYAKPPRD